MVSPNMLADFLKVSDRKKCDFTCFETIHAGGSAVHPSLFGDMRVCVFFSLKNFKIQK